MSWYAHQLADGHYVPALLTNWVFDLATILIFVATLRTVQRARSALAQSAVLLASGAVAVVLAFACLALAHIATVAVWGRYHDADLDAATAALAHFLTLDLSLGEASYFDDIAFATTTLLPTLVFIALLLVLIIAKGFLSGALYVAVHWLRLIADTHPRDVRDKLSPFLLLGTLIGIVGAVAKAVSDISSLLAK